jgi:hypothetical protein
LCEMGGSGEFFRQWAMPDRSQRLHGNLIQ